jgi:hypothetical protein
MFFLKILHDLFKNKKYILSLELTEILFASQTSIGWPAREPCTNFYAVFNIFFNNIAIKTKLVHEYESFFCS